MRRMTEKLTFIRATAVIIIAMGLSPFAHAAPKYKVLHRFAGTDGVGPYSGVIIGQDGNLYGTTVGGGTGHCGRYACGTVFRLTPQANGEWSESVLHSFESDGSGGADPLGGLIFDGAGNLYGTTSSGGTHFSGVVFELTPKAGKWEETVLHNFCSRENCSDGGSSTAGVIMDQAGNLYGTAHLVFELSHGSGGWKETVLHHFTARRDGGGGGSGLILDASGDLYGTTTAGGAHGAGTVYEMRNVSGNWQEQRLHNFPAFTADGQIPAAGPLTFDTSGNLYGTTIQGGANICSDVGCGTVFQLTPGADGKWKETILYNFKPGADGSFPTAGVVMDKAGNLFGTTDSGGASCSCGVLYKLSPGAKGKWTYTVLHRFNNIDGAVPAGNLTLDDKGNLYGGTVLGGTTADGVIFELTP
jgi:uncharacterized repeat protein (TIGR03803 family)